MDKRLLLWTIDALVTSRWCSWIFISPPVAPDMAKIEDVFASLKEMYPQLPMAEMGEMDYASGVPGMARKVESRAVTELGLKFTPYQQALKDSVDSMIAANLIAAPAAYAITGANGFIA